MLTSASLRCKGNLRTIPSILLIFLACMFRYSNLFPTKTMYFFNTLKVRKDKLVWLSIEHIHHIHISQSLTQPSNGFVVSTLECSMFKTVENLVASRATSMSSFSKPALPKYKSITLLPQNMPDRHTNANRNATKSHSSDTSFSVSRL